MKKKLLLLFLMLCWPSVLQAATHTAASVAYADVLTAYGLCGAGDTLAIPAGNATWSSTLTISKELILQGSGAATTRIDCNGTTALIKIDLSSDVPIEITGIDFKYSSNNPGGMAVWIAGKTDGSFALTQLRIHHNKFTKGSRTVYARGWVEGVIDHNEFLNCEIAIGITGDNNHSWNRPIEAGTANSLFIEDNTFTYDNNFSASQNEPEQSIYQQEGGRSVVRYNTFDATAYTNGNAHLYDTHGNQQYYQYGSFRGQPIVEIYENTMTCHHTYRMVDFRGGSVLFWNNTMTVAKGTIPYLDVTEEESWQTAFFNPTDDTWPAEDQIMNSFFWGNTTNGNPITDIAVRYSTDEIFIQKDRDYFMHVPEPTGGKSVYTGRPGAAGNGSDGTLTFSATGPNAYYPYTPYTYPHPLAISGAGVPPGDLIGGSSSCMINTCK